ncbi:hypothetical protein SAY87_013655 [Trapa incisa]|uniref:RRM domain-containing protein n=1 Tax=Trapa incisa TaxID=236973 RepID=A0AAN7KDT5_9MYRT|nr:hypothetical protein SAY87_013655 [Trapa incisa]
MIAEDEIYKHGHYQQERSGSMGLGMSGKIKSASRQIYLTFPVDSTFKDEDISEYFSCYGPVQDVRVPNQQKPMYGFVTFVYPDTVKLILSKGPKYINNTHEVLKRRLQEQAELLQALGLHERKLMNLQLSDLKNDCIYNQQPLHSLSLGSSSPIPIIANHNLGHHRIFPSSEAINQPTNQPQKQLQREINALLWCNSSNTNEQKDEPIEAWSGSKV